MIDCWIYVLGHDIRIMLIYAYLGIGAPLKTPHKQNILIFLSGTKPVYFFEEVPDRGPTQTHIKKKPTVTVNMSCVDPIFVPGTEGRLFARTMQEWVRGEPYRFNTGQLCQGQGQAGQSGFGQD